METYLVKKASFPLKIRTEVPGSKSITNRALLMASMAEGWSELRGVLFSDDSVYFLKALEQLGFFLEIHRQENCVRILGQGGKIPKKKATIYVGSAGTAARFLTAYLAMSNGQYQIEASEQMQKRPMRELFEALEQLGAQISYLGERYHFPVRIKGITQCQTEAKININIDRSSQFLSALLMTAPLCFDSLAIYLTGSRDARSYVEMTEQMMKQFGHPGVQRLDENAYRVSGSGYQSRIYQVEPDVSAACYFYAMAAVTGGSAVVSRMQKDSLQGDMAFLDVLGQMGCRLSWTDDGQLLLVSPGRGCLRGISSSFSDFSDQALTMAAIAPYADSPVKMQGIAHIRRQESDRISVMETELARMGIRCQKTDDGIIIFPGTVHPATIQTYDDHRVAMAFAITGLCTEGIRIENPQCCRKTFPAYFEVLDSIIKENE